MGKIQQSLGGHAAAADVADSATLRCIERAELATDVIGGSEDNDLLLRLNRGHWNYLAGDPAAAVELLEGLCSTRTSSRRNAGGSLPLLGRAYRLWATQQQSDLWRPRNTSKGPARSSVPTCPGVPGS